MLDMNMDPFLISGTRKISYISVRKFTFETTNTKIFARENLISPSLFEYICSIFTRYSSCHDLLLSRFCAADYRDYGIIGIKVHRITRIHNRMLRTKFDEKLLQLVEEDDQVNVPSLCTNANATTDPIICEQQTGVPGVPVPACPAK